MLDVEVHSENRKAAGFLEILFHRSLKNIGPEFFIGRAWRLGQGSESQFPAEQLMERFFRVKVRVAG